MPSTTYAPCQRPYPDQSRIKTAKSTFLSIVALTVRDHIQIRVGLRLGVLHKYCNFHNCQRPYPDQSRIKTALNSSLVIFLVFCQRPYPDQSRIKTSSVTSLSLTSFCQRPYPDQSRIKTLAAR